MVTTGTHYGLVSIGINNRMTIGYDTIAQPGALASNVAQGGAALAIALKTKDTNKKSSSFICWDYCDLWDYGTGSLWGNFAK